MAKKREARTKGSNREIYRPIVQARNIKDAKKKFKKKYGKDAVKVSTIRLYSVNTFGRFYQAEIRWDKVRHVNNNYRRRK